MKFAFIGGIVAILLTVNIRQQPRFRAVADGVWVEVAVFDRNRPVAGLNKDAFEVRDNGVLQVIDSLSLGAVPVDVTVLVDSSASVIARLGSFQNAVTDITQRLGGDDRWRLLQFSNHPWLSSPFTASPLGHISIDGRGGRTALADALLAAIVHSPSAGRRHLVAVMTDGAENVSTIGLDLVDEYVSRADALIDVALVKGDLIPARAKDALEKVVNSTGGVMWPPEDFNGFVPAMHDILADYRQRYIIRYQISGPTVSGWHRLDVRVTRPSGNPYEVRARKGYFVD